MPWCHPATLSRRQEEKWSSGQLQADPISLMQLTWEEVPQMAHFAPVKWTSETGATRQGWSKWNGGSDDSMNLRLSSSGCETLPAKGDPARAGSEACAVGGDASSDA